MTLEIISKSRRTYYTNWMGDIDDFTIWLDTTDSSYVKVASQGEIALLKISEIEAITFLEDDQ